MVIEFGRVQIHVLTCLHFALLKSVYVCVIPTVLIVIIINITTCRLSITF